VFRPETSIDRRAENTDSDVQHVPLIGGLVSRSFFGVRHRTLERRRLHSVSVPFDFDEVFDADYLFFYEPLFAEVTEADVDAIWRLLKLETDMAVLDLACGHGRIANRLAERGVRVTGLDASALFLEHARRDAVSRGIQVDYVEGDMRLLPWTNERFDRVLSWFTSFGYFDDQDNRRVLQEAHRVLRPDGRLLIENNNLVELLPRWQPAFVTERDGNFAIDRSCFDPTTGRATTERVIIRNARTRRFMFSVRMFVAAELRDWLLDAGFTSVHLLDPNGDPLTQGSRRMISIAYR
jgi:ubiquinone/menaquinone biosynthesis C-methylase UbiE